MNTFTEADHPRGQAANKGQFRVKKNNAPETVLSESVESADTTGCAPFKPGDQIIFDDFGVRRRLTVVAWADTLGDDILWLGPEVQQRARATLMARDTDGRFWQLSDIQDSVTAA